MHGGNERQEEMFYVSGEECVQFFLIIQTDSQGDSLILGTMYFCFN